jgi:hypothetical protein
MGQYYSKTANTTNTEPQMSASLMTTSAQAVFAWTSTEVSNYLFNTIRSRTCFNYGPPKPNYPCNQNIGGGELLNLTTKSLIRERWRYNLPKLDDQALQNIQDIDEPQDLHDLHFEIRKLHQIIFDLFTHLQLDDIQCAKYKSNSLPDDVAINKVSAVTAYKYLYDDYKTLWSKLSTVCNNIRVLREIEKISSGLDVVDNNTSNNFMHDLLQRDHPMSTQLRNKQFLQFFKSKPIIGSLINKFTTIADIHYCFDNKLDITRDELDYLVDRFQTFIKNGPIYDCRDPKIIQPAATKINTMFRGKLARTRTQHIYHAIHTIQSAWPTKSTNPANPANPANPTKSTKSTNIYRIQSDIRQALVSAYTTINPFSYSNTVIPEKKLNLV